jgi:hypothetical protein
MREYWNSLSQQMKPKFHEISAYLIAFAFCWLFVSHPEVRQGFLIFFSGFESLSPFFIALGLIFTGGLLLSLVHAFIKRKKSMPEKALIGWFVTGTSSVTSFFVGAEMLAFRSAIMMILPIWNILMSAVMLLEMGAHEYDVSDQDASLMEVFFATVILVIILWLADLYLHLSWALTLSFCIFYSTSIVFLTSWIVNYFDIRIPDFLK